MSVSKKHRDLEKHTARWQSRKMEKEQKELPTQLPRTVIVQKDRGAKKRKPIAQRPEDDLLTTECIELANRHISSAEQQQPAKRRKPAEPSPPTQVKLIPISTDMKPLQNFDVEHPPAAPELIAEDPDAQYTVSASALKNLPNLRHILSRQHRYFVQRNSRKVEDGILAEPKPVVSAKHIAKVLFEPHGHFGACVYAATGECCAQRERQLHHPLVEAGHPQLACMAYRTPEEVDAVASGLQPAVFEGGMCEFCERYAINMYVLERGIESHVSEVERPARYYKSGMPGEYSRRFMIQPTQVKGARYTDGVFGDVRFWSTADFVPVVGVMPAGSPVITETISIEQYRAIPAKQLAESSTTYVRGWKEIGGLYDLNESTLLETHQISPYERTYTDVEREFDLTSVLRGYFERRDLMYPGYARVYSDLMECAQAEDFHTTCPGATEAPAHRWAHCCLHRLDEPAPELDTHRIYYTLLVRLNISQALLTDKHPLPDEIVEKLRLFMEAQMPLLRWMDAERRLSDADLLSPVWEPRLQLDVPVLMQLYPRYPVHYRRADCQFISLVKRSFSRADPLAVTAEYYVAQAAQRYDLLLHSNLPTVAQLLYDVTPRNLSNTVFARVTAQYEKLCARLSVPRRGMWPEMPSRTLYSGSEADDVRTRRQWRTRRNAGVLTLMERELNAVLQLLEAENAAYSAVLTGFAKSVFRPFMDCLQDVYQLDDESRGFMVAACGCFVSLLPPDRVDHLVITPHTVNGQPWARHMILLTALVRVYTVEMLYSMELPEKQQLRHNLLLFRNSHLRLVRKITEERPALHDDDALLVRPSGCQLNALDHHFPDPQLEVHPGLLPNVLNGLVYVDFMGNNGMDEQPLIKILFKVLDRCCNGREFPVMLCKMCDENSDFNKLVMLMLELALKGLYEHDTEAVSFHRSLALDELFEAAGDADTTALLHRFVLDNPTLAKEAISEALCYMLDYVPHLRDQLSIVYEDIEDWRVRIVANMDMVRHVFSAEGSFARVAEIVYQRVHLGASKKIYRHAELSFVNFMCDQIREFDIVRYGARIMFTREQQITDDQRVMIDAFIRSMSPVQVIKLEALKLIFLSPATLDVIGEITQLFDDSGVKLAGSGAKRESSNPVQEQFLKLEANQYNLLSYFFESLRRYQNVRVIRLTNATVLEQQFARLCERYNVDSVAELPELATKVAYSPCCAYVKNAFPLRQEQAARGFDEVIYNVAEDTYICGKKEHKSSSRPVAGVANTLPRAIRLGKKVEIFDTKVARAQERENKKPTCRNTEMVLVDVLGEAIETASSAKLAHAKQQSDANQKRRRKNLPLPSPPLWFTPCCGRIYSYQWTNWTPNGYACGVCKGPSDIAASLNRPVCTACLIPIEGTEYRMLRCLDDVHSNSIRRVLVCTRCIRPWKHFSTIFCLSHVIHGITNPDFAQAVAQRFT